MILDLIPHTDPRLRQPSVPFNFASPQVDPMELAESLQETMRRLGGLGLSAIQCGIPVRAFALRSEPDATLFNPRIVLTSEETVEMEEACLTFPGVVVKVTRPRIIKLRFQVADGETRTLKLDGMTSRVVQHEIDHLDGKLLTSGLSRLKREMIVKRAAKHGHHYRAGDLT